MFTLKIALIALAVTCLCAVPFVANQYHTYLVQLVMINIIAAVGLNILTGNAGLISLCHSSFMAIGAYTTVICTSRLSLPYLLSMPLSIFVAACLGAMLGYPARRLSGLYLALVTLGFLELVQVIIEELSFLTGGVRGIKVPTPDFFGLALGETQFYFLVLAATCLALLMAHNLMRSRFGRAFNAIRESAVAAQALTIPLSRTKLLAFSISSGLAGLSGSLAAALIGFIDPTEFGILTALRHITYIVVGGLGSIAGSVAGAVILTGLPEVLREAEEYADLFYGVLLLAFLLFMPGGVVGIGQKAIAMVKRGLGKRA